MNHAQADLFHKLCEDPSVCNANAYFYARDGEGTPGIDWMCRKDLAENGSCWCGKLNTCSVQMIDGCQSQENG